MPRRETRRRSERKPTRSVRRRADADDLERQVRQADKLAALGTLLGGVAHELNNPLFIISGYSQLAREKLSQNLYEELPGDLERICEAAQRASSIVNRFLGVARRPDAPRESCRIDHLVKQALDLMSYDFTVSKITLKTEIAAELPSVRANPQDLSQVLLNLFTNARQAMVEAHGRGTLTVTAVPASDRLGRWVEVRVSDDGPGIAPQHRPRIFDPFYTTKPLGHSAGLGLSICHRVVTELGGTLTCESALGRGATFIIRLPVRMEDGG